MCKPESTPSRKANECRRGRLIDGHTQKMRIYTHGRTIFEHLCERRGAWAGPNPPLSQETRTLKQDLHTRDKVSNSSVEGEVHGQA